MRSKVKVFIIVVMGIICSIEANSDPVFPGNENNNTNTTSQSSNLNTQVAPLNSDMMVPPIIPDGPGNQGSYLSSGGKLSRNNSNEQGNLGNNNFNNNQFNSESKNYSNRNKPQPIFDYFKQNVLIRTGLNLSSYGASMFSVPDTFAPAQNIPVPAGYEVGPGDRLQIQVWGSIDANIDSNVAPDGSIFVPKVGSIQVTGVKAGNLDSYLSKKMGKSFKNFSLSSNVIKVRTIQVTVAGYANQPGTYQLSSLSTLTNAVFAVGGPSAIGTLRKVQLKRNGRLITTFDMYSVLLKGDSSRDVHLLPGDIIYFPPVGARVAIYEGVKQPAIYEVTERDRIDDLINYAGSYAFDGKHDKIVLETMDANKQISVKVYDTAQAANYPLSDGEIVHLFKATNTYVNSVAVVGSLANPTRVGYREGMKVNDLIPNKEALLTSSFWDSYAYNTYGKDNYITQLGIEKINNKVIDRHRGEMKLGSSLATATSTSRMDNSDESEEGIFHRDGNNVITAGPLRIPVTNINWNYAVILRVDHDNYQTHLIPFNLSKAISGDPANNLVLKPGDVINVVSSKDLRNPITQKPLYVFIDGEVGSSGVYELPANATLIDAINMAGGASNKAYLFGLELNRETVKKRQQAALNQMLDQAQQGLYLQSMAAAGTSTNATQIQAQQFAVQQQQALIDKMRNIKPAGRIVLGLKTSQLVLKDIPAIPLENGDTVYIPPLPGVIDVVGQVFNPASFAYGKGFTVAQYIDMAGTETQFADTSYEYILRADGTLYSKQQAGWFGGFSSRSLNPGDVIIVPQQVQYGATMQNLLNWTQILSNFGTAAAAIQVFKN